MEELYEQAKAWRPTRTRITDVPPVVSHDLSGGCWQYAFRAGAVSLKIFELNPRFVATAARGELFASAAPEDVVVLKRDAR
jgi:hypothetical protein